MGKRRGSYRGEEGGGGEQGRLAREFSQEQVEGGEGGVRLHKEEGEGGADRQVGQEEEAEEGPRPGNRSRGREGRSFLPTG